MKKKNQRGLGGRRERDDDDDCQPESEDHSASLGVCPRRQESVPFEEFSEKRRWNDSAAAETANLQAAS